MTEAKNVKEQFLCDQNMQNSYFREMSSFNASLSERRSSSRILYNCLIIRLSLLYASLPSQNNIVSKHPSACNGTLLLKYN